ncbi:hypothetical protein FRC01_014622, partial [Tulasnella sp. 417]
SCGPSKAYQLTVRPRSFCDCPPSSFTSLGGLFCRHQRNEWHSCECGKRFLDPAARSRCRARHSKSFGCPARNCTY